MSDELSAERADRMRDQVTEAQVIAAFGTAGLDPVASPAALAAVISAQLAMTGAAFAAVPFSVEPSSFIAGLMKERA